MAKKPKNYQPQQRKSRPVSGELLSGHDHHEELSDDAVLQKLTELFEVDSILRGNKARTLLGSIISLNLGMATYLAETTGEESEKLREEIVEALPEIALGVRDGVSRFTEETGQDVTQDTNSLGRLATIGAVGSISQWYFDHGLDISNYTNADDFADDISSIIDKKISEHPDGATAEEFRETYEQTTFGRLTRIFGARAASIAKVENRSQPFDDAEDEDDLAQLASHSMEGLRQEIVNNSSALRRSTSRDLKFLMGDDVTRFLTNLDDLPEGRTDVPHQVARIDLPAQELNFDVLPPGEGIREMVMRVLDGLSDTERAFVELERLSVLETIRERWGKERCYYARSETISSPVLDTESGALIDSDYIVLVLQDIAREQEHAIAISPIARKHGAYITRDDYSAGTWREILSMSKSHAKEFGARGLAFRKSSTKTSIDMMIEKMDTLLSADKDTFGWKLRMKTDGTYTLRNPS